MKQYGFETPTTIQIWNCSHYTYIEPKTLVLFVLVRNSDRHQRLPCWSVLYPPPLFSTDLLRLYVSFALPLFLSQNYQWDECRVYLQTCHINSISFELFWIMCDVRYSSLIQYGIWPTYLACLNVVSPLSFPRFSTIHEDPLSIW